MWDLHCPYESHTGYGVYIIYGHCTVYMGSDCGVIPAVYLLNSRQQIRIPSLLYGRPGSQPQR